MMLLGKPWSAGRMGTAPTCLARASLIVIEITFATLPVRNYSLFRVGPTGAFTLQMPVGDVSTVATDPDFALVPLEADG